MPLAEDMPRQAGKGLDTEDLPVAQPGPGGGLGGDQPAVRHGAVQGSEALRLLLHSGEGGQGAVARFVQNVQHLPLDRAHIAHQEAVQLSLGGRAFQGMGVHVVQGVPGDAAHAGLAARRRQISLQVPVAEMTVFGVDLPHHGHLLDLPGRGLHPAEGGGHLPAAGHDLTAGKGFSLTEAISQRFHPHPPQRFRRAGVDLIGSGLVTENGQRVPPHGGGQGAADHHGRDGEASVPVDAPHVQAQQGHLGVPGPVQGLPGQADAAGAPALVPCLAHEHTAPGGVVFSRGQGGEHLSGHQKDRVAKLVVEVPQAKTGKALVLCQQHGLPAVGGEGVLKQGEPVVQQSGDEKGTAGGHGGASFRKEKRGIRVELIQ